jgi:hypothetical protein
MRQRAAFFNSGRGGAGGRQTAWIIGNFSLIIDNLKRILGKDT